MPTQPRTEVHRDDDGELLGYVAVDPDGSARALTVFGGHVRTLPDADSAEEALRDVGLSVLAETWWYDGEPAVLLEAGPDRVVARVGGMAWASQVVGVDRADEDHRVLTLTGEDAEKLTLQRP